MDIIEHREPERVLTAEEVEAALTDEQRAERDRLATQQAVADALAADTQADLARIKQAISDLATLLGDSTTPGSVRALIGPTGAPAGTSNLRALRAKTAGDGTVTKVAASVDALAKLTIDLAKLVIDTDQAARRTARQVQRLALAATGTLTSADVGADVTDTTAA